MTTPDHPAPRYAPGTLIPVPTYADGTVVRDEDVGRAVAEAARPDRTGTIVALSPARWMVTVDRDNDPGPPAHYGASALILR